MGPEAKSSAASNHGEFVFQRLSVMAGAVLSLTGDVGYDVSCSEMTVAAQGLVRVKEATLRVTHLVLEEGGIITADEMGALTTLPGIVSQLKIGLLAFC